MTKLLEKAKNISVEFLESLNDRRVYFNEESLQMLKVFAEKLPLNPSDRLEVIAHLKKP